MSSQRYSNGRYRVREGLSFAADLERYIEDHEFLHVDDRTRITTASQRKRHRLYLFDFAPAKARVVMKVDTIDPRYSPIRRLELSLIGLLRDGLRRSYDGALALETAGIPSIKPLAHWTYRSSLFSRQSYFLYEAVETDLSLKSYRDAIATDLTAERYQNFNRLVEMMADVTRRMHAAGLRHGDIVTGNFLVCGHTRAADGEVVITANTMLRLIDTDHIVKASIDFAPVKRFFDMHCLRRLDFDDEGVRFFLRRYRDDADPRIPLALRFWERGGFKLSHWIKRRGKKRYSDLHPREEADLPAALNVKP